MPAYVAFLRAINLGPTRKFPKDAIKAVLEGAGFEDVETYLNTGNVRFTTRLRSRARVEAALEQAFRADRGFDVPTMTVTPGELTAIAADARALGATVPVALQYVSLLKHPPVPDAAAELEALDVPGEHVWVRDRAVHIALERSAGYHAATITNALVERRLGPATNRNLTVIGELADRWG